MLDQTVPTVAPPIETTHVHARSDTSIVVLTDADRVDFLQRMTTNDIARLKPGDAAVTVLTSPVARIVQVFTVLTREDALWLLPAEGEGSALARHLRSQIFFLDKVKVQEIGDQWRRLRVFGKGAARAVETAGYAVAAQDDRWLETDGVIVLTQEKYEAPGVEMVVPNEQFDSVLRALSAGGAISVDDQRVYEAARIRAGRPAAGAELTGEYSPLEVGMGWACADDKGCYTGQEIIARQRTYDKVTRTLVALRSDALLEAGTPLQSEGREVGKVTSAALDPLDGTPVALGVVKRPHNTTGSRLYAGETSVEVIEIE